jgi:hypothetical protein
MARPRQNGKERRQTGSSKPPPNARTQSFWSWMHSFLQFAEHVLEAVANDGRLTLAWGFGILYLAVLVCILALGKLSPGGQLTAALSIVAVISLICLYTIHLLRDSHADPVDNNDQRTELFKNLKESCARTISDISNRIFVWPSGLGTLFGYGNETYESMLDTWRRIEPSNKNQYDAYKDYEKSMRSIKDI